MSTSLTHQLCILIIDDDPDITELIARCMVDQSHQVVTASSAEEGMQYLPFYDFDLIFLDQNLPGMEGLTLGDYLHQNVPHISLALITGNSSKRIERMCVQKDIQLIVKPFEIGDLLTAVGYVQKKILEEEKRALSQSFTGRQNRQGIDSQMSEVSPKMNLSPYTQLLQRNYSLPLVPKRAQTQLTQGIKRALDRMKHSVGQEYEKQRAFAYAGLVTALVLGVRISKTKDGKSLWQTYDEMLEKRGELPEFKNLDS